MVNKKRINELLAYGETLMGEEPWWDSTYADPLLEALGDDQAEIKKFLSECDDYTLLQMSDIFEDIYGKFLNDDMGDFLHEKYEQAEAYRMSTIEKSAPIEE